MVLGKLLVPGRPTNLDYSRARAYCAMIYSVLVLYFGKQNSLYLKNMQTKVWFLILGKL